MDADDSPLHVIRGDTEVEQFAALATHSTDATNGGHEVGTRGFYVVGVGGGDDAVVVGEAAFDESCREAVALAVELRVVIGEGDGEGGLARHEVEEGCRGLADDECACLALGADGGEGLAHEAVAIRGSEGEHIGHEVHAHAIHHGAQLVVGAEGLARLHRALDDIGGEGDMLCPFGHIRGFGVFVHGEHGE